MRTEKLYESDSHLSQFEAEVLSCEKSDDKYKIILDKTAFFPEGGGQYGDIGKIGGADVLDTVIENGEIIHYTDLPLEINKSFFCSLDFKRRFAFMQNHSGEHIVSGIFHKKFGFDNVGFHLGEDVVTLDINGLVDRKTLDETEYEANKAVWSNLNVKAYFPDEKELEALEYRSKKEIDGKLRIVEIEGIDRCACCAPHVNSTGEIGIIKLLDFEKLRGGTRIYMKCGEFALDDYRNKYENIKSISNLLSSKQETAAKSVISLSEKLNLAELKIKNLKSDLTFEKIKNLDINCRIYFEENSDMKALQLMADFAYKSLKHSVWIFSKSENSYSFAVCGEENSLAEDFKKVSSQLNIRGGGRNGIRQGTVNETKEKTEEVIEKIYGLDRNKSDSSVGQNR